MPNQFDVPGSKVTTASDSTASSGSHADVFTALNHILTLRLSSHGTAIDIALSPSGDLIALLHTNTIHIYRIKGNEEVFPRIRLTSGTKWRNVSITDRYVAIYGINKNKIKEVSQVVDI